MKDFLKTRTRGQRVTLSIVVLIILVGAVLYWWQNYGPYDITTPQDQIKSIKEYQRYTNSLKKAWQNDTVGFATPEETFDAFREALKNGDYELAASYFVPQKQEEMLEIFKTSAERGFIDKQVELLYLPYSVEKINSSKVRYNVIDRDGHRLGYDLTLNSYNGIWKMYEL